MAKTKPKVARIALRYDDKGHYWPCDDGWQGGQRPSDDKLGGFDPSAEDDYPHLCFVDIELPEPVAPPSAKVLSVKAVKG